MSSHPADTIGAQAGLMLAVAEHILPLFQAGGAGVPAARRMAISALNAYEPETRADFVNAARTIAFSMASLALLGRTVSEDMPITEQMRAYGRANALSRSADQSERAMMLRRRYQHAHPPAEQTELFVPEDDDTTAEVESLVAASMEDYRAACRVPDPVAQPAPTPIRPAQAEKPVSAIHFKNPVSETGQRRPPTYKEGLLRHSAMTTGATAPGASPPPG